MLPGDRRVQQLRVPGQRPDLELRAGPVGTFLISTGGHPDVAELAEPVDVDQRLRLREPELHHRDQAVPPGQDPGFRAEPGQQGNRVLDAGCLLVLDVRRNLQHGLPACIAPWHAPRVYERLDTRDVMTLTQLNAFVLVARLGSVTAAANALGVSEPAVSQALAALRQHLGDQLVARGPNGMT